jgi:hypothetical protein
MVNTTPTKTKVFSLANSLAGSKNSIWQAWLQK